MCIMHVLMPKRIKQYIQYSVIFRVITAGVLPMSTTWTDVHWYQPNSSQGHWWWATVCKHVHVTLLVPWSQLLNQKRCMCVSYGLVISVLNQFRRKAMQVFQGANFWNVSCNEKQLSINCCFFGLASLYTGNLLRWMVALLIPCWH